MNIVKRDGRIESFDIAKVEAAIAKCFAACSVMADVSAIATRAVNMLRKDQPTVEDVQRAVIAQLWAEGLYDAAERYTLYREERRKAREECPIDTSLKDLIAEDRARFSTDLQYYQFISKFSRWREEAGRRETWPECVARTFTWFQTIPQFQLLDETERTWLKKKLLNMEASPSLRVLQLAGPALERCHVGAFNCAYTPINDLESFSEFMYTLMQGSGVGFSVESEYICDLPKVQKQKGTKTRIHVVEDTTESWCNSVLEGLYHWFSGSDLDFDTTGVRPAGAVLKTKGGIASGPGALLELLSFIRTLVLKVQGRRLTAIEVHDLCCAIARISNVGGVRRAACLSMSDLNSADVRDAKTGSWYLSHIQRSMANNSAVYECQPPIDIFVDEWLALIRSGSGERGIFNREAVNKLRPTRRLQWKFGVNPCGETVLRPRQFCNQSIAIVRDVSLVSEIINNIRAATYFGVIQSCATNFTYLRSEWKKNSEEERLLGVDLMGHLDHHLLQPGAIGRDTLVAHLKTIAVETAFDLAKRFNIPPSAAVTTIKPGGDSGELFCTSSLSPEYGTYKIRRTREFQFSTVSKFLKASGVPWEPAAEDEARLAAFAWPKKAPSSRITRHQMSAVEQLTNWLFWQTHWAEHMVSVTVYVKEDEWLDVGAWVYKHFDYITGVSFLPYEGGTYRTAPNEELTEAQYIEAVAKFPALDWAKLTRYEDGSQVQLPAGNCSGDSCEK